MIPPRELRATPYLYTGAEVAALIAVASSLRVPLRVATYQALIGLLTVTGLRIGEAIRLDRAAGPRPAARPGDIAVRVDRVLTQRKVGKHFTIDIGEDHLSYARDQDSITAEAALDGIYVLRTSVAGALEPGQVVSSYKALAQVERAFRVFNTDLDMRPIRHRTEERVRAHVFLGCCRTTSAGTFRTDSCPCCSPTTTSQHRRRPAQPGRPRRPLAEGPGQGSDQAQPARPPST